MATKDITDFQVVLACAEFQRNIKSVKPLKYIDDILIAQTGEHHKVVQRALERAYDRGFIECGMWVRGSWLTEKGEELLKASEIKV